MMDKLLGNIIDDFTLYRVIEGIITILILVAVYLGVQIILMWKSLNKVETNPGETTTLQVGWLPAASALCLRVLDGR